MIETDATALSANIRQETDGSVAVPATTTAHHPSTQQRHQQLTTNASMDSSCLSFPGIEHTTADRPGNSKTAAAEDAAESLRTDPATRSPPSPSPRNHATATPEAPTAAWRNVTPETDQSGRPTPHSKTNEPDEKHVVGHGSSATTKHPSIRPKRRMSTAGCQTGNVARKKRRTPTPSTAASTRERTESADTASPHARFSRSFYVHADAPYLALLEGFGSSEVLRRLVSGKHESRNALDSVHTHIDKNLLMPEYAHSVEIPPDKALFGRWIVIPQVGPIVSNSVDRPTQRHGRSAQSPGQESSASALCCIHLRHEDYTHINSNLSQYCHRQNDQTVTVAVRRSQQYGIDRDDTTFLSSFRPCDQRDAIYDLIPDNHSDDDTIDDSHLGMSSLTFMAFSGIIDRPITSRWSQWIKHQFETVAGSAVTSIVASRNKQRSTHAQRHTHGTPTHLLCPIVAIGDQQDPTSSSAPSPSNSGNVTDKQAQKRAHREEGPRAHAISVFLPTPVNKRYRVWMLQDASKCNDDEVVAPIVAVDVQFRPESSDGQSEAGYDEIDTDTPIYSNLTEELLHRFNQAMQDDPSELFGDTGKGEYGSEGDVNGDFIPSKEPDTHKEHLAGNEVRQDVYSRCVNEAETSTRVFLSTKYSGIDINAEQSLPDHIAAILSKYDIGDGSDFQDIDAEDLRILEGFFADLPQYSADAARADTPCLEPNVSEQTDHISTRRETCKPALTVSSGRVSASLQRATGSSAVLGARVDPSQDARPPHIPAQSSMMLTHRSIESQDVQTCRERQSPPKEVMQRRTPPQYGSQAQQKPFETDAPPVLLQNDARVDADDGVAHADSPSRDEDQTDAPLDADKPDKSFNSPSRNDTTGRLPAPRPRDAQTVIPSPRRRFKRNASDDPPSVSQPLKRKKNRRKRKRARAKNKEQVVVQKNGPAALYALLDDGFPCKPDSFQSELDRLVAISEGRSATEVEKHHSCASIVGQKASLTRHFVEAPQPAFDGTTAAASTESKHTAVDASVTATVQPPACNSIESNQAARVPTMRTVPGSINGMSGSEQHVRTDEDTAKPDGGPCSEPNSGGGGDTHVLTTQSGQEQTQQDCVEQRDASMPTNGTAGADLFEESCGLGDAAALDGRKSSRTASATRLSSFFGCAILISLRRKLTANRAMLMLPSSSGLTRDSPVVSISRRPAHTIRVCRRGVEAAQFLFLLLLLLPVLLQDPSITMPRRFSRFSLSTSSFALPTDGRLSFIQSMTWEDRRERNRLFGWNPLGNGLVM